MRKINYRSKVCIRCKREFIPTSGSQIYCKECADIIYKERRHKIRLKTYQQHKEAENVQAREYKKKHKERIKEQRRQYYLSHKEKENARSMLYNLTHKEYLERKHKIWIKKHPDNIRQEKSKRRNLDFIPLNKPFEGSAAHHLDKNYVIYIPKEIHKSIWHSVAKNINMDEINAIAFNYLRGS